MSSPNKCNHTNHNNCAPCTRITNKKLIKSAVDKMSSKVSLDKVLMAANEVSNIKQELECYQENELLVNKLGRRGLMARLDALAKEIEAKSV